jgi:hypothetical protein
MSKEEIQCTICGADSTVMYVNPITKLCRACTIDAEYNEFESRHGGEI